MQDATVLLNRIHEFLLPTIVETANARPEDYANVLFEDDAADCHARFALLKNWPLSRTTCENMHDPAWFILRYTTGDVSDSISISNRSPTCGELRGDALRKMLNEAEEQNPNQSVYEAIQSNITAPDASKLIYVKTVATGSIDRGGWGMTEIQYQSLVQRLLTLCKLKLSQGYMGKEPNFWDPQDVSMILDDLLELDQCGGDEVKLRTAISRDQIATQLRESEIRCGMQWAELPYGKEALRLFKALKLETRHASFEELEKIREIHSETCKALENPYEFDAKRYEALMTYVQGHRSWHKTVAGAMLMFLGAVTAVLSRILGGALITAGAGIVYHGRQHGSVKHMSMFAVQVKRRQNQPSLQQIEAQLARP